MLSLCHPGAQELYFDIEARLHRPPDLHELYFEIDALGSALDRLKGLAWPIEEAELLHDAQVDVRG